MRRAPLLLAMLLSGTAAACGSGSSNCPAPYDYSLSMATSSLAQQQGNPPLCSKCGGPSESPSYECQSTCATPASEGDASTGAGEETCIVDSCASAVLAKGVQCSAACAALYPGKTLNSTCSIASGTITCSLHEDNTCK